MPSTKNSTILLSLALDTWRFDMLNLKATPHIYHFSKRYGCLRNIVVKGKLHASGILSLFYSIISIHYWAAALKTTPFISVYLFY